ncbi:hypothetical protein D6D04_07629 [Aureobasidium pullulans]|nr:hypothetical protein D6D04_07629 [Aureobasidium pullulans]
MKHSDFQFKDLPELTGKVILITGGTSGLGHLTAKILATKCSPAHIYISGRNTQKANLVIQDLQLLAPSVKVAFLHMDLADLDTIAIAADTFLAENKRLDILIANAGIMATGPGTSKKGFEIQFATNFLGHALLISKLLPILLSTSAEYGDARIVSVTSTGFHVAPKDQGIIFDDLTTTQNYGFGSNWTRYGQSKLALLVYTKTLAEKYLELTTVVVHPGVIATDLVGGLGWMDRMIVYATNIGKMVSEEEGVKNGIWAATVPRSEVVSGGFYEPVGEVGKHSRWSEDEGLAIRLWEWTEGVLKEHGC